MIKTLKDNVSDKMPSKAIQHFVLIFALLAGTVVKLKFAFTTIGTNDVTTWAFFMNYIAENGSVDIYKNISHYNHPPLMSQVLILFNILQHYVYNGFPFLIRLPAILADIGSCVLVYKLSNEYYDEKSAFFSVLIMSFSPILIFVSGFHGNTDTVFMFLITLATYYYLKREGVILAAAILGLSLNIKIVPLITLPAFFFFLRSWKEKTVFGAVLFTTFVIGYGYNALMDFNSLYRNVFSYSGQDGLWGIGQFLRDQFGFQAAINYSLLGKLLIFSGTTISIFAISKFFHKFCRQEKREEKTIRGKFFLFAVSWTFLLFFVFTPGFGVQYLSWMVIPSIFLGQRGALFVNLVGGCFLFLVYTSWCGGLPWYYADSSLGRWGGVTIDVAYILWIFLVLWMCQLIKTKILDPCNLLKERS
ncbi:MAG: hypothetical protein CVV42_09510 [Candidatus Riflebacteria bacterium HGW-Riflebacteria-2]|nr:MAG: hypothetical protein CVV42_09510 [Candidatus Riflebacteria bacterium HGW-Riflebacteria-2]